MNNFNRDNLLLSILKKYFNNFFKLNSNIKLIDQNDYYVIYFMDKSFLNKNKDNIESLFKYLDNKYKNILSYLDLFIGYDYIYNFYINEEDLIEQEKNGLCNDLTFKLLQDYSAIEKTNLKILSILLDCYLETVKEFHRRVIYDKTNIKISISDCNIKVKNKKEYDNINNYEENDEYCEAA